MTLVWDCSDMNPNNVFVSRAHEKDPVVELGDLDSCSLALFHLFPLLLLSCYCLVIEVEMTDTEKQMTNLRLQRQ
jgi:hypothetical protein